MRNNEFLFVRHFFIEFLGYKKNNDTVITRTFRKMDDPMKSPCADGRGKNKKMSTDHEGIKKFIEKFNPVVSHYQREKTPLHRYLPMEVTVRKMHDM